MGKPNGSWGAETLAPVPLALTVAQSGEEAVR